MYKILTIIITISLNITHLTITPMNSDEQLSDEHRHDVEKGVFQLEQFYNKETKVLDLRNLMLRDSGLKKIFPCIKKFINLLGVKSLILERNKLKTIPYYVITFALINRSLRYVSMKDNRFSIKLMLDQEEIESLSIPLRLIDDIKIKELSKDVTSAISRTRSDSKTRHSALSSIAAGIWDGLSPEIEKMLLEHNSGQKNKILYKKIIIIDKNLPPITIIDNERVPKGKLKHLKSAASKFLLILIGITISLLPQIIEWIQPENNSTQTPTTLPIGNVAL